MIRFPLLHVAAAALLCATFGSAGVSAAADVAVPGTPTADAASTALVTVIVQLDEEPVARYRGGIRGLAATSPRAAGAPRLDPRAAAVRDYRAHLAVKHAGFARTARAAVTSLTVLHEYDMVIGGLAVQIPENALPTLRALPGVTAVHRDTLNHPDTDLTPAFIVRVVVKGFSQFMLMSPWVALSICFTRMRICRSRKIFNGSKARWRISSG